MAKWFPTYVLGGYFSVVWAVTIWIGNRLPPHYPTLDEIDRK